MWLWVLAWSQTQVQTFTSYETLAKLLSLWSLGVFPHNSWGGYKDKLHIVCKHWAHMCQLIRAHRMHTKPEIHREIHRPIYPPTKNAPKYCSSCVSPESSNCCLIRTLSSTTNLYPRTYHRCASCCLVMLVSLRKTNPPSSTPCNSPKHTSFDWKMAQLLADKIKAKYK